MLSPINLVVSVDQVNETLAEDAFLTAEHPDHHL